MWLQILDRIYHIVNLDSTLQWNGKSVRGEKLTWAHKSCIIYFPHTRRGTFIALLPIRTTLATTPSFPCFHFWEPIHIHAMWISYLLVYRTKVPDTDMIWTQYTKSMCHSTSTETRKISTTHKSCTARKKPDFRDSDFISLKNNIISSCPTP